MLHFIKTKSLHLSIILLLVSVLSFGQQQTKQPPNKSSKNTQNTSPTTGSTKANQSQTDKAYLKLFKPWEGQMVSVNTFAMWTGTLLDIIIPKYGIGINPKLTDIIEALQKEPYALKNIPRECVDLQALLLQRALTQSEYVKNNTCIYCKRTFDGAGYYLNFNSHYPDNCDVRDSGLGGYNLFDTKNCALKYCKENYNN
jgi:hypothetical protein